MSALAQQYIEFIAKGMDRVDSAMDTIRDGLENVTHLTKGFAEQSEKSAAIVVNGLKNIAASTALLAVGLQKVTSMLEGFVRSGLAGTSIGNLLTLQFQVLSREIASIFLPTIMKVSEGLQRLLYWFRSLNGSQQNTFQRIGEGVAVFVAMTGAVRTLTFALGGMSTTLASIAGFVAPVVVALAALTVGTESGRMGFARMVESMQPILDRLAAFGSRVYQAFLPAITAINQAMESVFAGLSQQGNTSGINSALSAVGSAIEAIAKTAGELIQVLLPLMQSAFQAIVPVVVAIANGITFVVRNITPLVDQVLSVLRPAFEAVSSSVGRMIDRLQESGVGARLTETFSLLGQVAVRVFDVIGSLIESSLPALEAAFNAALPLVELFLRGVNLALSILIPELETLSERIQAIGPFLGQFVQGLGSAGALLETINSNWETIGNTINDIAENGMGKLIDRLGVFGSMLRGLEPLLVLLVAAATAMGMGIGSSMPQPQSLPQEIDEGLRKPEQKTDKSLTKPKEEGRRDAGNAGGQFEQATSLFRRLQEAALKGAAEQRKESREERNAANLQVLADAARNKPGKQISGDPMSLLLEKKSVYLMNGGG